MFSMRNRIVVGLVLATVVVGLCAVPVSAGKPADNKPLASTDPRPLSSWQWDMNAVSWKDMDSIPDLGSDYIMQMDEGVLWNAYDYAEVEYPISGWGFFNVDLYCYGGRAGYTDRVRLWVKVDTSWYDYGTEDCPNDDYDVVSWFTSWHSGTDYYFRFQLDNGFLKYGPNSDWDDAVIRITSTSSIFYQYFEMDEIRFNNVDSCWYDHETCGDLHSHVDNHVLFRDQIAYLMTPDFTTSGTKHIAVYVYAKCLAGSCSLRGYVDSTYIGTSSTFYDTAGWNWVHVGSDEEFSGGSHYVRVFNGISGYSDVAWDDVFIYDW